MDKDTQKQSAAEARDALLAAAHALMTGADGAHFSLKKLYAQAGVSRATFRRCFADRAALLAAVTQGEARALSGLIEKVEPVAVVRVASGGGSVAPIIHGTDAWLERRLRVFERALAALESRQEKSDRSLALELAKIREALAARVPETPSSETIIVDAGEPDLAPVVSTPAEPIAELAALPVPESVSAAEIENFIAHARRIAQDTMVAEAVPAKKNFPNARWIAWSGAVFILLLCCTAILLANGALGYAADARPQSAGIAHRRVAQTGIARMIALADSGNASAQASLAFAYLRGQGVPGDDMAARRWSHVAAAHGNPMAQYLLGTLYLQGDGVAPDAVEAVRWFRAAAGQGNVKAMHNLGIAYVEGQGVEKDPVEAVQWFRRAAQLGYRDSAFDLAVMHERGLGVAQSIREALTWYLIAAAKGDAPSAARAAFLRGQLAPSDAAFAENSAAVFVPDDMGTAANRTL